MIGKIVYVMEKTIIMREIYLLVISFYDNDRALIQLG